jgi:hypothetical protein
MAYYEVNFDDGSDSLCLVNNHANFIIWKSKHIDQRWPVMAEWIILCSFYYRNDWLLLSVPASY